MAGDLLSSFVTSRDQAAPILHLFGGPYVTIAGARLEVPEGSKRLLVFVTLHRRPVERRLAAGVLWPSCDDIRAAGNLRSALWRLRVAGIRILSATKTSLSLRDGTIIDIDPVLEWAQRLVNGKARPTDLDLLPWGADAFDILPGWYDDWALMERERVRQRTLRAVEALSRELARIGRIGAAIEAAIMAVGADPLRESAQRALIEAHIADGNLIEASRRLDAYQDLLQRELGVDADRELRALIRRSEGDSARRTEAARIPRLQPQPLSTA
jgi:DNA-binding SARP family transcriptional activator